MANLTSERFKALPERLTISFWIWGFMCGKPGNVYHDLDRRMLELKERGFNCIRMDSGAGFAMTCPDGVWAWWSCWTPFPVTVS